MGSVFGEFHAPNSKRKWTEDFSNTDIRLDLSRKDPTLRVFSVLTGGTSGHYELVVLDDPITKELVGRFGKTWFDKVWDHYVSLGYVVKQNGLFILVMTRYGEDDLCGRIIEREIAPMTRKRIQRGAPEGELPEDFYRNWPKYAHLAGWKVIYRQAYDEDVYDPDVPGDEGCYFPIVWPKERIEAERLKSDSDVAAQLQNTPAKRKDNPIQQHHIDRAVLDPEAIPPSAYDWVTCHMDVAWKDDENYRKQRGDWNVIQLWGHADGVVYLLWAWHSRTSTQNEFGEAFIRGLQWAKLSSIDAKIRVGTYDKERGGHTGAVKEFLERVAHLNGLRCPRLLPLNRPRGMNNTARILSVVGYWQDGRVKVPLEVEGAKELVHEMLTIDFSRHDDHASAAADVWHDDVLRPIGRVRSQQERQKSYNWTPAVPGELEDEDEMDLVDNQSRRTTWQPLTNVS
jgi:phage terminase large subunit-like protein